MVPIHFHLSFSRHPLTYLICKVSFSQRLNCFSGKWENKRIVLVISRMLKEKNRFPNSKHLVTFKVTQAVKQSVLSIFFITRDLSSLTRMLTAPLQWKGGVLITGQPGQMWLRLCPGDFVLDGQIWATRYMTGLFLGEKTKGPVFVVVQLLRRCDSVKDPESRAVFRHMHGSVGSKEGVLVSTAQWMRRKDLESQGVTGPGRSRSPPRLSGHEFD